MVWAVHEWSLVGMQVQPYSAFYLVTHHDLVKFGLAMAPSNGQTKENRRRKALTVSPGAGELLDQIKMAIVPIIVIYHDDHDQMVDVNRLTGKLIKSESQFSFIQRFDPETFPKDDCVVGIHCVNYWTQCGSYVKNN